MLNIRQLSAQELLVILPLMSTLMAIKLRQDIDDDITLVQFRVLSQLQERSITLTELAEQRRVTRQAASLHMQGLVERGWVRRVPDPNDRRQAMLEVTAEGLAQLQKAQRSLSDYMARLLEVLTPAELDALQLVIPALHRVIAKSELLNSGVPTPQE